jgi:hypothetical protein
MSGRAERFMRSSGGRVDWSKWDGASSAVGHNVAHEAPSRGLASRLDVPFSTSGATTRRSDRTKICQRQSGGPPRATASSVVAGQLVAPPTKTISTRATMLITDAAPAAVSGDPWEAVAELKTLALLTADIASAVNSRVVS